MSILTHPLQATVRTEGRTITNLRFADDIDGLAGEQEEMANLVERLDKTSTTYGMEISAEKTKLTTNNTSGIDTDIKVNRKKLETVISFKYLGSFISDEGSKSKDSTDDSSTDKGETSLEQQEHFSKFQHKSDVLPCHIHRPVCL